MERLEELVCIQENGQIVFANSENGCWVKMPLSVYQKYTYAERDSQRLCEFLQKKYNLFQPAVKKEELLRSVYFAVTGKCNMCCSFCTMNSSPDVSQDVDLTLEEIKNIVVPKLKELRPKKIVLTGGEPFTRADMCEILELFGNNFDKNIITLQTNGLLLTTDMISRIADYVGAIEFSIENLFLNKEQLSRMKEIFTECKLEGILLSFSFVANDATKVYIKEAIDLSHMFHAVFSLRIVSMMGRARKNHANDDIKRESSKMEVYTDVLRHIIDMGYYEEEIAGMFLFQPQLRKNCGALGKICAIHADGKVYMCENFKNDRYSLGSIRQHSIMQIKKRVPEKIKSKKFVGKFIEEKSKLCEYCKVKAFCAGHCVAELAENIEEPKDACVVREKLLCFNLFYKNKMDSIEGNLKNLYNYLAIKKSVF